MFNHNFVARLVALALALVAAQTRADDWWTFVRQTPGQPYPTIHVYSDDGTRWDRVGDIEQGLSFHVDARGLCPESWRTHPNSTLGVHTKAPANQLVSQASLNLNTELRSYGPNSGAGWQVHNFKGPYVPPAYEPPPDQMCNTWLGNELVGVANPDQKRKQLLANGITKTLNGRYTATFNLWCQANNGAKKSKSLTTDITAKVVCHGNPAALNVPDPPARREKTDDGIYFMDIWANPASSANYKGFCPKKITFGGEIEYKVLPGRTVNLKYRYVARRGATVITSDYFTTVYNTTARKNLHSWGLDFPLHSDGPQIAAPTNAGTPDVYGGNVVLEFVGAVPFHANLQPVQFNVTCLKEGTVNPAVSGVPGNMTAPAKPREMLPGSPQAPAVKPQVGEAAMIAVKSDLAIRSIAPASARNPLLLVTIANLGAAPSTPTQLSLLLPDGKSVRVPVGAIPAQGQLVVRLSPPASLASAQLLRLRVDDPDRVDESNEANNEFSLRR